MLLLHALRATIFYQETQALEAHQHAFPMVVSFSTLIFLYQVAFTGLSSHVSLLYFPTEEHYHVFISSSIIAMRRSSSLSLSVPCTATTNAHTLPHPYLPPLFTLSYSQYF